jgi:hypothetical protein
MGRRSHQHRQAGAGGGMSARWNNPRLLRIGKEFAADSYNMAEQLNRNGADATVWLLSKEEQHERNRARDQVCIPAAFADALMALLLSLRRRGNKRGRRPRWTIDEAQTLYGNDKSKEEVAQELSKRTGLSKDSIRPQLSGLKREVVGKAAGTGKASATGTAVTAAAGTATGKGTASAFGASIKAKPRDNKIKKPRANKFKRPRGK